MPAGPCQEELKQAKQETLTTSPTHTHTVQNPPNELTGWLTSGGSTED